MAVRIPVKIRRCAYPTGGQRSLEFYRAGREERRLERGDAVSVLAEKHGVTTLYLKRLCAMMPLQRIDSLLSSVREATGEYPLASQTAVEAIPDLVQAELKDEQIVQLIIVVKFHYAFRKGSEGEAVEALYDLPETALKLRRMGYTADGLAELISRSVRVNWNNRGFSLADLPRVLSQGIPESTVIDFFEMPRPETLH